VPDTDLAAKEPARKPTGSEEIGSISDRFANATPIVEAKVTRKKKHEKNISAVHPSKLEWASPDCLNLPEIEAEGIIVEEPETEAEVNIAEKKTKVSKMRTLMQAHTKFASMPPCTHCGPNTHVTKADIREKARNIQDTERNGIPLLIVLIVQRYYCSSCKKTFTPRLAALAGGKFSRTQRLFIKMQSLTFQRRTTSDIAVLTSLSRRLVQNLTLEAAKSLPTPQEVFLKVTTE
jgi:transposase-like protein